MKFKFGCIVLVVLVLACDRSLQTILVKTNHILILLLFVNCFCCCTNVNRMKSSIIDNVIESVMRDTIIPCLFLQHLLHQTLFLAYKQRATSCNWVIFCHTVLYGHYCCLFVFKYNIYIFYLLC